MVALKETFTWGKLRRQARANLAEPTTSFAGKTVLMTGSTGIICSEAARILARLHVDTLVLGVRNTEKGNALADELVESSGMRRENILVWTVDHESFDSVKEFAAQAAELPRLDVAVLGVGVINEKNVKTGDGWEGSLQVMHLSTALLTVLLLPKLHDTANTHGCQTVLSNVSTCSVWTDAGFVEKIGKKKGALLENTNRSAVGMLVQYCVVKSLYYFWLRTLSRDFDTGNVLIQSLVPGVTDSPMTEGFLARGFVKLFGRPAVTCARSVVNSCVPFENGHGALLIDSDIEPELKFLSSKPFISLHERTWTETNAVLEKVLPENDQFFADLDSGKYKKAKV